MSAYLDLKRMRYIVETARASAITTAAETLGITQSALSRSIAEVEEELGIRLFDRVPRGIALTEAGERFVTKAKLILGSVDDLVAEVRESPGDIRGRLKLGVTPASYVTYVGGALEVLAKNYPDVSVEVVTGAPQVLCPLLLQGGLNLIVGSSSYLERWKELEVTRLAGLHFACMLRKDHPLAGRNDVTEEDILSYPIVLPESVEPVFSDVAQRYAHYGLGAVQPRYAADDVALIRRLISTSDAWFPLMHPFSDFGHFAQDFWLIRNGVTMPPHFLSIASPRQQVHTPLTDYFCKILSEQFQALQPGT